MREVCRGSTHDSAHRPGEGHARASTPTPRGYLVDPRAVRGGEVPLAPPISARVERLLASGASTRSSATSSSPVVNLPDTPALPVDPLHPQRRGGNLAAARGERRATRSSRCLLGAAVAADAALRARRARAVSIWCSRCPRRTARRSQRLYPDALRTPAARRPDRRRYRVLRAGAGAPSGRAHLVFTGSMDWLPNEDGMLYFVRDILPRIRQVEPDATLSIIGRSPTPAVQAARRDAGIEVTGRVDDVRPHIAAGAVYVVPLRIGGGTRLKIFEAMAMGKAVVSTTVGAEGLPVTTGPEHRHRRRAGALRAGGGAHDSRQRRAPADRDRGQAQLVVERYDWSAVAQDFEDALTRAASRLGPRGSRTRRVSADVPQQVRRIEFRRKRAMKVSVFGLGYVGSVSAASFAADGHTVVGVDVNRRQGGEPQRRAQPDRRKGSRRADSRQRRRTDRCGRRPAPTEAVTRPNCR